MRSAQIILLYSEITWINVIPLKPLLTIEVFLYSVSFKLLQSRFPILDLMNSSNLINL